MNIRRALYAIREDNTEDIRRFFYGRKYNSDCDCHPENDVPMVPDVGMFASFDPVALDLACVEAVNRQPVLPGSRLAETADPEDHDHLHAMHPNTCWRAAVEHGKKIGLGTDDYTVITVK